MAIWAVVIAVAAPCSSAIGSAAAIRNINAVRAEHGIPPLVEDPGLSAGCRAHAHYMRLNDGFDRDAPHRETPGRPGYTQAGDEAARHSVLASGGWRDPQPWSESAPGHQRQVLDPQLERTGYGEEGGYLCLQTITSPRRSIPDNVMTVPGPGATGVLPQVRALELNSSGRVSVPGDAVGLRAGTVTGPYLIVYTDDASHAEATGARLVGPSGPVGVEVTTDGFVIPRHPLAPRTTYTASVEIHYPERSCYLRGSPTPAPETDLCPPEMATWCTPFAPPGVDPSTPMPYRICAPGEPPPSSIIASLPGHDATHTWQFRTGNGATARRSCRPHLSAPRRVRRGGVLRLRYHSCTAVRVTATVYKRAGARRAHGRALLRRSTRERGRRHGTVRVRSRSLRPGRYVIRVVIRDARGHRTRLVRRFRVTA